MCWQTSWWYIQEMQMYQIRKPMRMSMICSCSSLSVAFSPWETTQDILDNGGIPLENVELGVDRENLRGEGTDELGVRRTTRPAQGQGRSCTYLYHQRWRHVRHQSKAASPCPSLLSSPPAGDELLEKDLLISPCCAAPGRDDSRRRRWRKEPQCVGGCEE
jgi:hypothetical protein